MHGIYIQTEYMTNNSSEKTLKFGEYWEISEKHLLKFWQKLENSVKTVVWNRIVFYSKELIIQNASAKYKLWFQNSGVVKKILSVLVTQDFKKVFILFLRIIPADFHSSYVEPSTLKMLHSIGFCIP